MSNHGDAVFIRNFSMVMVGLCIVGVIAFVLAKIVYSDFLQTQDEGDTVAMRVAPVGQVNTGSEPIALARPQDTPALPAPAAAAAPAASAGGVVSGKGVYDRACFACHAQGIAGAPKYGDAAAWEARLAKGRDTLVEHSINGFTGTTGMMPAKGGNPTLSDEEVTAAADYMMSSVGGDGAPSPAAPTPPEAQAEPAAAAEAPAVAEATAAADAKGKDTYDAACFVCHTPGVAGAPKLGDAAAWTARIEKGLDSLYHNAINGYMGSAGMMPPKGGRPDFSDEDVKAAVDYMVAHSK